jgi:plasmid stabilization system protein ParE
MLVRWTKPAADDLTHISDYTQEHFGPAQARRTALAIYEAADSLTTLPSRGRPGRKPNTRELVISGLPFVIIYRIRGDAIEITRVLHGAQKWL